MQGFTRTQSRCYWAISSIFTDNFNVELQNSGLLQGSQKMMKGKKF